MWSYLITYDLHAPPGDYASLHDAIRATGKWWRHLESTWIVTTALYSTPDQVFAVLSRHLGQSDRVLVVRLHAADGRQGWLPQEAWDWLGANVAP